MAESTVSRPPLVFVPGFMGSELWSLAAPAKRLWPNWHFATKGAVTFEALEQLAERPKMAGDLFPDVYSGLVHALRRMGYVPNKNLWLFPYDWTQSNKVSAKQLAEFVERITAEHKQSEVDLVSHSMGGISLHFGCCDLWIERRRRLEKKAIGLLSFERGKSGQ